MCCSDLGDTGMRLTLALPAEMASLEGVLKEAASLCPFEEAELGAELSIDSVVVSSVSLELVCDCASSSLSLDSLFEGEVSSMMKSRVKTINSRSSRSAVRQSPENLSPLSLVAELNAAANSASGWRCWPKGGNV